MSKSTRQRRDWPAIIRRQRASGLSVAEFCRREAVPASSFFAERKRLPGKPRSAPFVEVTAADAGGGGLAAAGVCAPAADAIEVRLRGGRRVVVRPGFDRPTLLDLVRTLEVLP